MADCSIKPERLAGQRVVVCKMGKAADWGEQVFAGQAHAWQPSCCLQDRRRRGHASKPGQEKTLGAEPSCCLQAGQAGRAGPVGVAGGGCVVPIADGKRDTASSNRDDCYAIGEHCPDRLAHTPHRLPASVDGSAAGAGAGKRERSTLAVADEIERAQKTGGRAGTTAAACHQAYRRWQENVCRPTCGPQWRRSLVKSSWKKIAKSYGIDGPKPLIGRLTAPQILLESGVNATP